MDTPTTTVNPQPAKPYMPLQNQVQEISIGEWMVTLLLTYLPLVNIVMLFVWAFGSGTNPTKANWAKASLIWMLIGVVIAILFIMVIGTAIFHGMQSIE